MFRKFLDKVKSTNFEKLKRDGQIQIKRASFYTKKFGDEFKSKVSKTKVNEKFPALLKYLKDTKKNFDIEKLDNIKNKKIDEWNYKFEDKVKNSFNGLKNMFKKSKEIPKVTKEYSKSFMEEAKSYVKDSYKEGVAHMKNYFKNNQKYFEFKRKEYFDAYKKKRNNILMIGGGALFIYSVGSNIPHAIMSYKLAQSRLENSREQVVVEKNENGQNMEESKGNSVVANYSKDTNRLESNTKTSNITNSIGIEVKSSNN